MERKRRLRQVIPSVRTRADVPSPPFIQSTMAGGTATPAPQETRWIMLLRDAPSNHADLRHARLDVPFHVFAPRRADTSLSPVGLLASQLHKTAHGNAPLRSAPGLHRPGHQQFEQPACANRTSSIERHQCPDSHPWPGASRFRNRALGFTGLSALTARPSGYGSALSMLRRSSCAATRAGTFGRTPRADPSSRNAGSDDQRVGDGPGVRSAAR
jgi:hypothetical protein